MPIAIETWRDLRLRRFMLYDESYVAIGYDEPWSGAIRLALLLFAMLLSVAFLVLMPRRATWFTPFGTATMYIYLLHTFILFPFRETPMLAGQQPFWVLPAMMLFCIGDLGGAVAEAGAPGVPAARRAAGEVAVPPRAVDGDGHARAAARCDAAPAGPAVGRTADPTAGVRAVVRDRRRRSSRARPEPRSREPSRARDAAAPSDYAVCRDPLPAQGPGRNVARARRGRVPASEKETSMSENAADWRFETKQVHSGAAPDPVTNARATPIYQTTSYVFNNAQHAQNLFALAEFGNIYTRIMNPTQAVVEERLAALEGGTGALLVASGQAAETFAVLNIAQAGDHIVSSSSIYGGTYNLFKYTLAKLGIETTFVENQDDADEWRRAVRPNTKLFFAETIGNPKINILDIELVAGVAHEAGIPLIVDNTIATPYLIRPFEHGADIVIHSATKFLGGHGTVIGGVIVDGGRFQWSKNVEKFPGLTEPDPSYHGASYTAAVGDGIAYVIKARVQLLRDLGAAIAPDNAWLLIQGIETLSLRIERHVQNAQEIAEWLDNHPDVASVNYSGLPSSPWYAAANKYAPEGRRRGALVRAQGRRRRGPRARRQPAAVQPPREHRRRALARHPPGVDDALAAHPRAAAHDRRHAGPRAPLGGHRERRRPQGRPRGGLRRRARRHGGRARLTRCRRIDGCRGPHGLAASVVLGAAPA